MTESFHTRIADDGRVVIPALLRRELGLHPGTEVVIERSGDAVRVCGFGQVLREAQSYFQQFVRPGQSVVEELIADRRADAAREEAEEAAWLTRHIPESHA